MATPYKMKGSPMQRNFGVGSPARQVSAATEDAANTSFVERDMATNEEYKKIKKDGTKSRKNKLDMLSKRYGVKITKNNSSGELKFGDSKGNTVATLEKKLFNDKTKALEKGS